jgi:hypothetical protein
VKFEKQNHFKENWSQETSTAGHGAGAVLKEKQQLIEEK